MGTSSATAIADGGKALGLSVVLGLVLAFVPLVSLLALPLLPIPAAFMAARHRVWAGALVGFLTAGACAPLAGFQFALLVLLLTVLVGSGLGLSARKGMPLLGLLGLVAALFLTSMVVWTGAILALAGTGPVEAIGQTADAAIDSSRELYLGAGMDQQTVDELLGQARELAEMLPYLLPGIMLLASLVLSGSSVAVARGAFRRLRQPFPAGFSFAGFRLHFVFAYAMIAGLVCELVASWLAEGYSFAVSMVGMNLIMVTQALFFIQGLAIAHYFLSLHRTGAGRRVLVFGALGMIELFLPLVSWLGLFDTWFDYRRRFGVRKGNSPV